MTSAHPSGPPSCSQPRRAPATPVRLAAAVAALFAAGCSNISGLGGTSEFHCAAPQGIPCQSVTGVHLNERAGNLPAQRSPVSGAVSSVDPARADDRPGAQTAAVDGRHDVPHYGTSNAAAQAGYRPSKFAADPAAVSLGAIRSDPTVIRIWIAPWEDADGDLNDQGYVYLQIDSGRWLIEHNRARIRREFTPQRAPVAAAAPAASAARASAPTTAAANARAGQAVQDQPLSRSQAAALGRSLGQGSSAPPAPPGSQATTTEVRP
jgi:conjugal transfer pilus assembly protein TraV